MDRRGFFGALILGAVPLVLHATQQRPVDSARAGIPQGDAGFLPNPALAGVSRPPVTALDNDPIVVGIEHRVRCPCPCGLDVYTCRTTDFTCSYSPQRHQEIMAMVTEGMSPDQVVGAHLFLFQQAADHRDRVFQHHRGVAARSELGGAMHYVGAAHIGQNRS